jgi:hypothetical protein
MGQTVLGVHHVRWRVIIVVWMAVDRVTVFGVGGHRKTMMCSAVQRSFVVLVRWKLAGILDGMMRGIGLAIVGSDGAQRPRAWEVIIFIWGAR